jgi:hypothetical protein
MQAPIEMSYPPLKFLHAHDSLNKIKLAQLDRLTTELIRQSLLPGQRDCLKAKPDGTLMDGHHRVYILQPRGLDVDALPREIIVKSEI